MLDPDKAEDALKVDADEHGDGGDDMYDETRYGLMSRPRKATALQETIDPHDPKLMAEQGNPTLGQLRKLQRRDDLKRRARLI